MYVRIFNVSVAPYLVDFVEDDECVANLYILAALQTSHKDLERAVLPLVIDLAKLLERGLLG